MFSIFKTQMCIVKVTVVLLVLLCFNFEKLQNINVTSDYFILFIVL